MSFYEGHTSLKTKDSFVNPGNKRYILLCFFTHSGSRLTLEVIS